MVRPLVKQLKKGTEFKWDEQCDKVFEAMKKVLLSPPTLMAPIPGKDFLSIIHNGCARSPTGARGRREGRERSVSYLT